MKEALKIGQKRDGVINCIQITNRGQLFTPRQGGTYKR